MEMEVGKKYELFYQKNNRNNFQFEIRVIVDSFALVLLTQRGKYRLEDIIWWELNVKKGFIREIK